MATDKRQFTLRIQEDTYEKMRFLAFVERRSIAMEIETAMIAYIKAYEKEHGPIQLPNPLIKSNLWRRCLMAQANPYPLRVDKMLMEKFKIVAADHGRSVNKEIESLMKQAVQQYEKEHGPIQLPESCD